MTSREGVYIEERDAQWSEYPSLGNGKNVVVIVLDDVGFGQLSCYGGTSRTPNIDGLAMSGSSWRSFHTSALCAPTRASLMTGRNPHSVGFGMIPERASGFPGFNCKIPPQTAMLSEILSQAGYSTFAVGKWHMTPVQELGPSGPFSSWPTAKGFDRFYGFMGAETDQYTPELYADNTPLDEPEGWREGYHLTEDLVDQSIGMISRQRAASPERPFFLYLALGAAHTPHQVPAAWVEPYRGQFDAGWDVEREKVLERQKRLGVSDERVVVPPPNPGVQAWSSLSEEERRVYARMMEVFAGFLSHTDDQIGRLLDHLEAEGAMEDTVFVLLSDNGASAEGGPEGSANACLYQQGVDQRFEHVLDRLDDLGGPDFYNHYPWGWAQAGNTPYRWYKQYTDLGGVADPLIIKVPGIEATPPLSQYHHVSDVMPTILELLEIDQPTSVGGVTQNPIEGMSMVYAMRDPAEPGRRHEQYYEVFGNRGLWRDGWLAISRAQTTAPAPLGFVESELHTPPTSTWELYDLSHDPAQHSDVSNTYPEKAAELENRWWASAGAHQALPLDTRGRAARTPMPAPRPGRSGTRFRFVGPSGPYERSVAPETTGRSFSMAARIGLSKVDQPAGVLYSMGSRHGGYTWYLRDGSVHFEVNLLNMWRSRVSCPIEEVEDRDTLEVGVQAFQEDGGAWVELTVDGQTASRQWFEEMLTVRPLGYGRTYIGSDPLSPVSTHYEAPFAFNGEIHGLWIEPGEPGDVANAAARAQELQAH